MIAFAADALVDAEYLLDDDDRAARRPLGLGGIDLEAAVAFERRNLDHRHAGLLYLRTGEL